MWEARRMPARGILATRESEAVDRNAQRGACDHGGRREDPKGPSACAVKAYTGPFQGNYFGDDGTDALGLFMPFGDGHDQGVDSRHLPSAFVGLLQRRCGHVGDIELTGPSPRNVIVPNLDMTRAVHSAAEAHTNNDPPAMSATPRGHL